MDLFLKIIGGLTVAVILLVGSFLFLIWWKFRSIAKELANSFPTPATIDLTLEADPKWLGKEGVPASLAALEACGYTRGPAYTVDGMPGISLLSLHHPATGIFGCHYKHPAVGNWTDLCAYCVDGPEISFTTAPNGQQLDTRPGTDKVFLPGTAIPELHARITERLAGRPVRRITPENFKAEFRASYARDMTWRNGKDGTSEEEFLRIATDHGKTLTDEQLKEAFKETKLKEIERWSGEILGDFEKSTTLSVAEWKKYENYMVIFRDSFHPAAYLEYLTNIVVLKEGEEARYQQALEGGLSLSGLLARIAADTRHEFIKLGEVEQPRKTGIYGVKVPEDEIPGQ